MSNRTQGDKAESQQMDHIRQLLLGEDNKRVRETVEENAREIVSNVLTEALHDRQKSDGTVSKILTPLVEKSVEASVVARKEQFVSYLYPLVGGLVRKSVSAFLADIIEQTNALLESSLTFKGLKWRFKARQAGVSYSQYVVSQTFLYRVEQVLLIHYETGLLLKSVVRDKTQTTDADMVSAMLTAINDFVADSFTNQQDSAEQSLDEIKTDDFTLLIKRGPEAILVAAVSGNVPANIGEKLQVTLEDIHRIYGDELDTFEGDATPFENTEQQLSDCLIAQQLKTSNKNKKKPWLAILLTLSLFCALGYYLFKQWQLDYQAWQIRQLPAVAGIVLRDAQRCDKQICVEVLRDPAAQETLSWLATMSPSALPLNIKELAYQSLEPQLQTQRLTAIAGEYSGLTYSIASAQFEGELTPQRYRELQMRIASLPDSPDISQLISGVTVKQVEMVEDRQINAFLLNQVIDSIEQTSISFSLDDSKLTDSTTDTVNELSEKVISLTNLSAKLNQHFHVVIMGISDPIGSTDYNQRLSTKRAQVVRDAIIKQGVDPQMVKSVGLGVLDSNYGARRVMVGVIKFVPETPQESTKLE